MIITSTPYRISFFGGGTDYPCWYKKYGGAVLGATIDKYCWIAVRPPTPFGPRFKVVYSQVEECDKLDDIQHPAVRECLRWCNFGDKGCEVHHWGDLPARSGMGSSSAFVVGLLCALWNLAGCRTRFSCDLAREATEIEQRVLGETVGDQDQILCAYGGLNLIEFGPNGPASPVPINEGLCRGLLRKYLMLFYTGIQRTASDVAATYLGNFESCRGQLLTLTVMARYATGLIQSAAWKALGLMLHEAWELKKSLGPAVTTPRVDELYKAARGAGAWGGKLLGAGGGGFLLLCCPEDAQGPVRSVMLSEGLVEVPVKFDWEGSRAQRLLL